MSHFIYFAYDYNADLRTDQWVNCGPGLQVWFAVYPLIGLQVRKSTGLHYTRACEILRNIRHFSSIVTGFNYFTVCS